MRESEIHVGWLNELVKLLLSSCCCFPSSNSFVGHHKLTTGSSNLLGKCHIPLEVLSKAMFRAVASFLGDTKAKEPAVTLKPRREPKVGFPTYNLYSLISEFNPSKWLQEVA